MWSTIMYDIAKERQADFEREAEQARMARAAQRSEPATGRAGEFFRRMIEQAEQWIVVRGLTEQAARPVGECEQLAC
jgi:hypothetical protein